MNETIEFSGHDGARLLGTLARPATSGDAPAALLISGSGPLDRDSNMPGQALNIANAIASALAVHGMASLRYDKRGAGQSGGDYLTTGFDQETSDASAALEELRRTPGIDGNRLTAIGHSAGATIAIRLAGADHGLAGAVLLCAASRPGSEVMRHQSERIAASMRGPSWLLPRRLLRRQERHRRLLLASTEDVVRLDGSDAPARWLREYMVYDPAPDIRAIRCPVLAITGRKDIQVDPDDVARIGQIVAAPFTGHTPDDLTHLLRRHPGPPSLKTYRSQIEKPIDVDLLERIVAWTATHPARPA